MNVPFDANDPMSVARQLASAIVRGSVPLPDALNLLLTTEHCTERTGSSTNPDAASIGTDTRWCSPTTLAIPSFVTTTDSPGVKRAVVEFGPEHSGHPGRVHGGAIAAFCELFGAMAGGEALGSAVVTRTVRLKYVRPLPLELAVSAATRAVIQRPGTAEVGVQLRSADDYLFVLSTVCVVAIPGRL